MSQKTAKFTITVVETAKSVNEIGIKNAPKTIKRGAAKFLTVTITPANATGAVVKWSSNNEKVISVDAAGKIKALKPGEAKITATAGGKSASLTITVK
jgi:alpha-amylase